MAVTAVAGQILYPFAYIDIINGGLIGVGVHTVRIVALLAAMALAVRALLSERTDAAEGTDDGSAKAADQGDPQAEDPGALGANPGPTGIRGRTA